MPYKFFLWNLHATPTNNVDTLNLIVGVLAMMFFIAIIMGFYYSFMYCWNTGEEKEEKTK